MDGKIVLLINYKPNFIENVSQTQTIKTYKMLNITEKYTKSKKNIIAIIDLFFGKE